MLALVNLCRIASFTLIALFSLAGRWIWMRDAPCKTKATRRELSTALLDFVRFQLFATYL